MAQIMKTCRNCGKQYEACRTPNPLGIPRWRDVACSPQCYQAYVSKVMAKREEELRAADNTLAQPQEPITTEIDNGVVEADEAEPEQEEAETTVSKKKKKVPSEEVV